jgi:NAD(P)H-flavin reductase/ferredoxin
MKRMCTIAFDGENFLAPVGERLLDAAMRSGIDLPYDCRAGTCGTCILRLDAGRVLGGDAGRPGYVRACQAHVLTDLEVSIGEELSVLSFSGRVHSLAKLTRDVIEVAVVTDAPAAHRPGQYFRLAFDGLPERSFSPTAPLAAGSRPDDNVLRFHIRQFADGVVSSKFGTRIQIGSPVAIDGPFGISCLEPDRTNRLVLISGGTGFAPVWSIARAALKEFPARSIVLVAGVRQAVDIYMEKALQSVADNSNVSLMMTVDEGPAPHNGISIGRPVEHMPRLEPGDVIHVAGPPPLVDAVTAMAREAGCRVHADAFVPAGDSPGIRSSIRRFFSRAA